MGLFIKQVFGVLLFTTTTKTDACRQLAFNAPITGKILVGHVINTAEVIDVRHCRVLCYMEADCKSFNMAGVDSEGKPICELNKSDDIQHPGDLISSPGSSYHGTENKCSGISPPAHRKCQNGFTNAGFQFVCSQMGKSYGQVFGWTKINTDPVCFGARGDSSGNFIITTAGQVFSFKLLYVNGAVSCNSHRRDFQSKWGCYGYHSPYRFDTHITYPNRTRILPAEKLILSRSTPCNTYHTYALQGFSINSNEIIFNNFSRPISVCPGDQFQIWYGQDLFDCSETNNGGKTCTDVYGLYV